MRRNFSSGSTLAGGRRWRGLWAACGAIIAAAAPSAMGQEAILGGSGPGAGVQNPPAASAPLALDSEMAATVTPQTPCLDCETGGSSGVRPVNWISGPYFKGGPSFVIGDDLLETNHQTGYAIAGGYRQPLGPDLGGDRLFFDVGGSYLSAFGDTTRNAPGRVVTTIANTIISTDIVPDFYQSTLKELRRGSAHAALGWYWGDPVDSPGVDPQLRVATRLGGRYGHVRGRFNDVQIGTLGAGQTATPGHEKTDTFGGLFVSTEVILLRRHTAVGDVQWTIDGELANDWIDIGGIWEGSLGTGTVMFGLMLSR